MYSANPFACPWLIVAVIAPIPSTCAPENEPPDGAASYVVPTKSSLPGGAGTETVQVRGRPVWPPHAAEPDEMSVSDSPRTVFPPCAYTLMSIPLVDGETNFGRRTLPATAPDRPPRTTVIVTVCAAPAGGGFAGFWTVGPAGGRSAPAPPPHPASRSAAAQAAGRNVRTG